MSRNVAMKAMALKTVDFPDALGPYRPTTRGKRRLLPPDGLTNRFGSRGAVPATSKFMTDRSRKL